MRDNPAHQEERREELIGGKIVMMAPASAGHLYISNNIYRIFGNYSVRLLLVRKTRQTGPRPAICPAYPLRQNFFFPMKQSPARRRVIR